MSPAIPEIFGLRSPSKIAGRIVGPVAVIVRNEMACGGLVPEESEGNEAMNIDAPGAWALAEAYREISGFLVEQGP